MKYAKILFTQKVGQIDDTLTYSIPEEMKITEGDGVKVSIRRKEKYGIVLETTDQKPPFKTLPIIEKTYNSSLLNEERLKLLKWMSKYYLTPLSIILKLLIPKRILENKPIKERKKKEENDEQKNCTEGEKDKLEQKKYTKKLQLTNGQKEAIEKVRQGNTNKFLIHGVTGSGKTEIYAQLAKWMIDQDKQVLILVPEISLTPQMITYFENSLQKEATIINSKLSEGEKYRNSVKIQNGEAKLIIGSRSAIFAPYKNLGIIVVDEEHEQSYKQENTPRYHTHKIIDKIQEYNPEIITVYGSATPNIETLEKLKTTTITLTKRINSIKLPQIEIVDLREEFKKGNHSILSDTLREEMEKSIKEKKQIILFLNRRGSASSVVCRDCGYIEKCKNCETKLTYHARTLQKPSLMCHHCGAIHKTPEICPICKGANIRYLGIGTQKIENEINKEFPNIKTLRADRDTTTKKDSFKKIYKSFLNKEADILIGTQMIAKGLHFPDVNLVGVILADVALNIPDFRSEERIFQLMTQVAGRSGRSKEQGKVIIQSYNPKSAPLTFTQENDNEGYIKYERTQRKLMQNPPFSNLTKLQIEEKTLEKAKKHANDLEEKLWASAREKKITKEIEINTYPAYIPRYNGKYRYIILIKIKTKKNKIHELLENLKKEDIISPNIKIDIDPINIT